MLSRIHKLKKKRKETDIIEEWNATLDKQYKTIAVLQHQRLLRGANLKIVNGRLCSTTFKILSFKLLFSKIRIPPIFNYNENKLQEGSRYFGVNCSVLAIVVRSLGGNRDFRQATNSYTPFLYPYNDKLFKSNVCFVASVIGRVVQKQQGWYGRLHGRKRLYYTRE